LSAFGKNIVYFLRGASFPQRESGLGKMLDGQEENMKRVRGNPLKKKTEPQTVITILLIYSK
jgi:hypothetical protein